MEDLEDVLLEMEQELAEGKKSIFGNGVTVNAEAMYGLIDRIRNSMPDVVREARYIVQNNERFRQEETLRAQNLIATAQQRHDQLVSEHQVAKAAKMRADEIVREAEVYARDARTACCHDLGLLLQKTGKQLEAALNIIRSAQSRQQEQMKNIAAGLTDLSD